MIPAFIAVWFSALFAALTPAWAHQAPSGVPYLPSCCSKEDCGAMPDSAVEELGGGYVRMTFKPGSHPMWGPERTHDLVVDFEPKHRRDPLDGDWHGCIDPRRDVVEICYHPPARGF
jgi:hypothetical protein